MKKEGHDKKRGRKISNVITQGEGVYHTREIVEIWEKV